MDGDTAQQSRANVARNAGIVSLAVMASRVLGLVRDQVFAALFGAPDCAKLQSIKVWVEAADRAVLARERTVAAIRTT